MSEVLTTCANCQKEFVPRNKYAPSKTCSKECRYALSAATNQVVQGKKVTRSCPVCDTEFRFSESRPQRTCSVECRGKLQTQEARAAKECSVCGEEFTHYARQSQNTCSVKCAARARGRNYPSCETCGEPTGGYDRVFCDEHRGSRRGRKPSPRKSAICVGCGQEFSRPGGYPGRMKYCSNKCSHHEVKSVRDKYVADLNGKAVVFHSLWEVRFVAICARLEVDWRRYDGPDIKTSEGVYRPDFIVGPDELIVEVKGWEERPGTPEKLLDAGVVLVGKESLNELEHIFNREQFLVILRKA